jgi:metallo-beta-lactamase family protein
MASIQFLGAAGTVTGSRFLLEHEGRRILIDCGLFQGPKQWRLKNWEPGPLDPRSIDAVVLTHAHIDHSGGLPRLVKQGYQGPVYCTPGTRDLVALLLPDSARLQEEEARYANKERYSKHSPALPLYDEKDALRALRLLESINYERPFEILPGIRLTLFRAGHLIGSAVCSFELLSTGQQVVFTGDLGRFGVPILRDPQKVTQATTLVAECTYGDRRHRDSDPSSELAQAVNDTVKKGGMLVIPAFAVGRTQDVLYRLRRLEDGGLIPVLDVFVDSPMACDATPIYLAHPDDHDLAMSALLARGRTPLATARTQFVTAVKASQAINDQRGPGVIISASGMATGGRILHHLKHRLPHPRNTVVFVGYQPQGTRGRRLLDGEPFIRIHGADVKVRAEIRAIDGFSAHADYEEMDRWMDGLSAPPRQTLLVHGEPAALQAQAARLAARGWPVQIPEYLQTVELR